MMGVVIHVFVLPATRETCVRHLSIHVTVIRVRMVEHATTMATVRTHALVRAALEELNVNGPVSVCVSGRAILVEQEPAMTSATLDTVRNRLLTCANPCFAARTAVLLSIPNATSATRATRRSTESVQSATITVSCRVLNPTRVHLEDVRIPAMRP
jgi:hypothetical protein